MRDVKISPIRSIERAIAILQAFAQEKPSLSLEELSQITQLPRSTVYRILCTLEGKGMVTMDPKSVRYKLGFSVLALSTVLISNLDLSQEAEETLIDLHNKTGQSVAMAVKDEDEIVYVFGKERNAGLKLSSSVGQRRPFMFGVLGPVILAFEPEDKIDRILSAPLHSWTPYTVTDRKQIRQRLQKIKEECVFCESDETTNGVAGIGAPIFGPNSEVIAAIGVIGPTAQLADDKLKEANQFILDAAMKISKNMGYSA